jgi:hypothetical protein
LEPTFFHYVLLKIIVMTNDDESFLSAYMDGQLDPEQQQRVEAAVAASPHVAEKLRALSLVRDMVAGLPHDGWVDVSARVVQEIEARRRQRGFVRTLERWRSGSRRILPLAGLAATAATLMLAASLAILVQKSQLERGAGPLAGLHADKVAAPSETASIPVLADGQAISSALGARESLPDQEISGVFADRASSPSALTQDPAGQEVPDAGELLRSSNLEHLRRFLDDPSLKRFFLVQSGPKDDSEEAVASVVEHTTHLDFFKITVSQGIVIDPRHPDAATVFAFVIDPNEADWFHDQLKAALPGLVEQKPLDPAIATALAEISEVQSLPPKLLAKVEIPREAMALRTKASGGGERPHSETEVVNSSKEAGPAAATSERAAHAARAVEAPPKSGLATAKETSPGSRSQASDPAPGAVTARPPVHVTAAHPAAKPQDSVVVLVWVAKPSSG